MKVDFTILGEPQGKGRPRFARSGKFVKTYTPDKTVLYENLVRLEYERQCKCFRFDDDSLIEIKIYAYYGIRKSISKKKKADMLNGTLRPIKKPDIDNVLKVIADSLNGVAYKDDTQIINATIEKYYSENPRVEVFIQTINDDKDNNLGVD